MNISEALLHALKAHGAREIFGIPGDYALPFFKVIEETSILPLYTLSHEPAIGFAADAAARIHSGLGVAAVTYGAGALNMVNPIAAAFAEKSPVVVISGAPGKGETQRGLLLHHQAKSLDSQYRIYQEITCAQTRLDDALRAPEEIARVLRACMSSSRPVYIELPRDMVSVPCAQVVAAAEPAFDAEALIACAGEILARLRSARSPVLMIGVEVRRFGLEDKVAELARRLGLPVVTSLLGRGLLANTDAPLLGTYIGVAGLPAITDLVENSDALFLLGVIVSDTNLGVSAMHIDLRMSIQALDRHVIIGHHVYPGIPLGPLVDALLGQLPAQAATAQRHEAAVYPRGLPADAAPVRPLDIATAINDLMDAHGKMPIATDIGDCMFLAMDVEHTALVAPGYYATMGFGVPAGLGLQAATGQRPLIIVGDGAFQMTGWELGNCRRHGWDPIVLLVNNASWEMLRAFQPESKFNDLDDWHFAEAAAALGGEGVRVHTRAELAQALAAAQRRRGKFQMIEVMVARGAMSPTLARFVEGVKSKRT